MNFFGRKETVGDATPAFAVNKPPLRRDVACFTNPQPDLNRVATGAGP